MRLRSGMVVMGLVVALASHSASPAPPTELLALSLGRAATAARARGDSLPHGAVLGMTDLIGFIVTDSPDDLVILGRRRAGGRSLGADGVANLLRAAKLGGLTGPGVSLEPIADQPNVLEAVYFGADTKHDVIGALAFAGDLKLKRIALGFDPSQVPGLQSYADRVSQEIRQANVRSWEVISRFWFSPGAIPVLFDDNIWILQHFRVPILVENSRARINGEERTNHLDQAAARFAADVMARFAELAEKNPEIGDVHALIGSLQVASLIHQRAGASPILAYWSGRYRPIPLKNPRRTAYLRRHVEDPGLDLSVFGGVRAAGLALQLQSGKPTAWRDVVLRGRPSNPKEFAWRLTLTSDFLPQLGLSPEQQQAAESFIQGSRLREKRRFSEASAAFESVARFAPEAIEANFLALVCRREAMLAAGAVDDLPACLDQLRRFSGSHPEFVEGRYEVAATLSIMGEVARAAAMFEAIATEFPSHAAALYGAATAQRRLGNNRRARELLERCLAVATPADRLHGDARRLVETLKAQDRPAERRLFETAHCGIWRPATWDVLGKNAAQSLLPASHTGSTIEGAFVHPTDPDSNIVITSKPLPAARWTGEVLEQALGACEARLKLRPGYRRLEARILADPPGFRITIEYDRLGRRYRQRVSTRALGGMAVTVTCSAPTGVFEAMTAEAFAMTDELVIEPLGEGGE